MLAGFAPFFGASGSGAPPVTPGSVSYTTAGSFNFTVPAHNTLTATVKGGSGGGGGGTNNDEYNGNPGSAGGQSKFAETLYANGGGGGSGGQVLGGSGPPYAPGAPGTASGGTTNTTGGGWPGGAAAPPDFIEDGYDAAPGGASGLSSKAFAAGQFAVGAVVNVTVGSPGAAGHSQGPPDNPGSPGHTGSVDISWN